ncbi:MAG: DUF2891 domain-containing protein [Planctomycetota bacterium]|jgi:hypothetical protein
MPDAAAVARRCVALALDGLPRAYPNKIAHVLHGPDDVRAPRALTPIFYGCFDWHSSVHAHWTLARCCRLFPREAFVPAARAWLDGAFTDDLVAGEVAYLGAPGRAPFERPYGLAWLLQLAAELHAADDDALRAHAATLAPLETLAAERLLDWLPRLTHPVRTGEHSQTAFAMGLALDWAEARGREDARRALADRARHFHAADTGWNLAFEPGGQDFLSPGLAVADLMRRVLDPPAFARWLDGFLPDAADLRPVSVADRGDGKLAHLDGLNLSRAWMMEGIAEGLPPSDDRRPALASAAGVHRDAGLAALNTERFETTHWLGTFAVYLVTRRGIRAGD